MKHVIASEAEKIFHTLLALDDGANRSAQLALEANFSGMSLHDVFDNLALRCVRVFLSGEIYHFIVGIGIDSLCRQ